MFVSTKATVKGTNGNTLHSQGIGIILCLCLKYLIIYLVGPVYYRPGHPSNTISSGALKFYVDFQKFASETLEHCDFFDTQGRYWISPYQTHNNLDYLQIEIFEVNPHRDKNIFVKTVCGLSKQISL